jgi:hypothetical protein
MMDDFNSLKADEAALTLLFGKDFYVVKEKASYDSFEYEGENNKYVLMVIDDSKYSSIAPSHRAMFDKLLAALKLDARDIAIVNIAAYPGVQFSDLKKFFTCNRMVLWGAEPSGMGISAEKYQPVTVDNVQLLYSDNLDVISKSGPSGPKNKLWLALQKIFLA